MLPPRCKAVSFTEQCISVVCREHGNQQCNITVENKIITLLRQKLRQIEAHIAPSLVFMERYVVLTLSVPSCLFRFSLHLTRAELPGWVGEWVEFRVLWKGFMKWNNVSTCTCKVRARSSWNVMAHGDAREWKWRRNWRLEWVASTLHTTTERGVSSITTADAHTSAASSRLNWRPRRFKWTRPFRRKTKSGFCSCGITFQTQSTKQSAGIRSLCNIYHLLSIVGRDLLLCCSRGSSAYRVYVHIHTLVEWNVLLQHSV
jgi:hypothetical protein